MKYIFIGMIINCSFFSCSRETNTQTIFRVKLNDKELTDSLYYRALGDGDTSAYRELRSIYTLGGFRSIDFLGYAMIMFNEHHFKEAAGDAYYILTETDSASDAKTREMTEYYFSQCECER